MSPQPNSLSHAALVSQVVHVVFILTPGVLEGVGQNRQAIEGAFLVNPLSEDEDGEGDSVGIGSPCEQ